MRCLNQTIYSELAQLAEHLTVNQVVAGSSPAFGAKRTPNGVLFCCLRMLGVSPPTAGSCFAATQVVWSIICATSSKLLDTLPTLLRKFRSKRYSIVLNSFPSIRSQNKKTITRWSFCFARVSVARNSVERSERAASTLVCRPDLSGVRAQPHRQRNAFSNQT